MAPKIVGTGGSTAATATSSSRNYYNYNNPFNTNSHSLNQQQQHEKWVPVSWMPHTALSPTSHVCCTIHSAHVVLSTTSGHDDIDIDTTTSSSMEWQVRMGIYGIGNLPLIPSPMQSYYSTKSAPVTKRTPLPVVRDELYNNNSSSPTTTSHHHHHSSHRKRIITIQKATHQCIWDYFTVLSIRWRDLPRDAFVLLEIGRVCHGSTTTMTENSMEVLYHTTLPLFTKDGILTTGLQKIPLYRSTTHCYPKNIRNLGLYSSNDTNDDDTDIDDDSVWRAIKIIDQLERIEHREATWLRNNTTTTTTTAAKIATHQQSTYTDHHHGSSSVPWLDTLMKERALQEIHDSYCVDTPDMLLLDASHAYLIIEFPQYDIPILYEETFYPIPQHGACGAVSPVDVAAYRKRRTLQKAMTMNHPQQQQVSEDTNHFDPLQLVTLLDYENENDNPVEDKYRTLAHDLLRGLVDPALKPDREQRNRLNSIIDAPSHHPTREETDLLWRFRFSLVDNRRALTKFLLAVDWTMESEVIQAAELLEQWRRRSPIEVTDALKLLGKDVAFQTNLVRDYAIDTLAAAPDSELRLYLLQLVQALKYENFVQQPQRIDTSQVTPSTNGGERVSSLATFLIHRAAGNIELANYLYWYLKVELEDPTFGSRYRDVFNALETCLSQTPFSIGIIQRRETQSHPPITTEDMTTQLTKSIVDSVSKLGSTLRSKGDSLPTTTITASERTMWNVLVEQDKFISGVLDIQLRCRDSRGKKDAKEAELKSLLSKEGFDRKLDGDPVPLPSRPDIFVNGVRPETAIMFKSALYPALLEFRVEGMMPATKEHNVDASVTSYKVIVKTGDDLRQDQLIIMMIQLMDKLLKRGALDLCLTPYSIIATSTTSGLVEFVDKSMPVSQVLSKFNGSILQFFQSVGAQKGAKYNIRPDAMSAYIRSCAGYCVITFLLGVGDRHLDNIMLRTSGHFFHIDFGFIFGRDPKPLPPAFRLTREMVDGMGGLDSNEYRQFCSLACQAYNALRKSAGLILNLLNLMSDAGIDDLSNNPSADAEGVIAKVEERFRLDLNDEQAERYFIGLINDCLAAIAPRVMDVFHSIAVARR